MRAPEPSRPPEPPTERRRGSDPPRLRLSQLRLGQIRTVGLRLAEVRGRDRTPTEFFLDVKLNCVVQGQVYLVDVKADFGSYVPPVARLTVLKSRAEATPSATLVEDGVLVERSFPLDIDESAEQIVFWVVTDGAPAVPRRLAASIKVCPSSTPDEGDGLDTMRLPTEKQALKEELAHSLRHARSAVLSTLGYLMASDEFGRKCHLLEGLVDQDADVRLVEAAVRDLHLCEQTVNGFPAVDFSRLCLSDPVDAGIAVFHPASSPYLVEQCLNVALLRQTDALATGKVRLWRDIVKAAVLLLHRRAPELLDGVLDDLLFDQGSSRLALLRRLIDWAAGKSRTAPRRSQQPIDEYLQVIEGEDAAAAEKAAFELMADGGFVSISTELD